MERLTRRKTASCQHSMMPLIRSPAFATTTTTHTKPAIEIHTNHTIPMVPGPEALNLSDAKTGWTLDTGGAFAIEKRRGRGKYQFKRYKAKQNRLWSNG